MTLLKSETGNPIDLKFGPNRDGWSANIYLTDSNGSSGIREINASGSQIKQVLPLSSTGSTAILSIVFGPGYGNFGSDLYILTNDKVLTVNAGGTVRTFATGLVNSMPTTWPWFAGDLAFSRDGNTLFVVENTTGTVYAVTSKAPLEDGDGDDIVDEIDNCPEISNPNQSDRDLDDVGDECDCAADDPNEPADDGRCPPTCGGAPAIWAYGQNPGSVYAGLFLLMASILSAARARR